MAFPFLTRTACASVACALTLTSCDKLVNGVVNEVEFPEHEPRLAFTMFLAPGDTVVEATIYRSAGILDSAGSQALRWATLKVSQDGQTLLEGDSSHWMEDDVELWMQDVNAFMSIDLDAPLTLGEGPVVVEVDASPEFEPLVLTEEVPEQPVFGFEYVPLADSVDYGWWYMEYIDQVTLDLTNRPGVRDDYMVFLETYFEGFGDDGEWYAEGDLAFPDPRAEYSWNCGCVLVTDNGQNNIDLNNLVLEMYAGDVENPDEGGMQPKRIRVVRPSADLANYFRSVEAYYNAQGNPFAEPTSIQGNIPDGFGIFGLSNEAIAPLN